MSNLTIIEKNVINQLPISIQEFVSAKFEKPIKEYKESELKDELLKFLIQSYAEMGQGASAKDQVVSFLRDTLYSDFQAVKFQTLTLGEIKLFVKKGIRGEYSTFNGQLNTINIQNIHHWIRQGLASEQRASAIKEFNKKVSEAEYTPTIDKLLFSEKGIQHSFDTYKLTGSLPISAFAYYDLINEKNGIEVTINGKTFKTLVPDPEIRKEIFKTSKDNYKKKLEKEKFKAESRGDKIEVESIVKLIDGDFKDGSGLNNEHKRNLLTWYFNSLIKEGKNKI